MKKGKRKLKKYVRKVKKTVSFLGKMKGGFSKIFRIFWIVFQIRILIFVAPLLFSLAGGFFGWSSWQDAKFWKAEAERISIEADTRIKLIFFRNRLISKQALKEHEDGTIDYSTTSDYIPPEAPHAEVLVPKDPEGKIEVNVRKFGLTFRPGIGYLYAHDRIQPAIDLKLLYLYRWGVSPGIATRGPTIALSRHLDDIPRRMGVPWLRLDNLELQGGWQPVTWREMTGGPKPPGYKWFGGLRVNF